MADKQSKQPESVSGQYYVDEECIDCDLCREEAPKNFTRQEDEGYSYVYKQPSDDEERQDCKNAMENCPVEAIGNDGDDE
jgi:ferredoxin